MGETVHDFHANRHRMRVGSAMEAQDEAIRFDLGVHQLDSGWSPRIPRGDISALHAAAQMSVAVLAAAMDAVYGAWWTGYVSACDAAGVTGLDRPERIARGYYLAPPDFTIP